MKKLFYVILFVVFHLTCFSQADTTEVMQVTLTKQTSKLSKQQFKDFQTTRTSKLNITKFSEHA